MKKYWSVFKISFVQEFAYKANFIMWRVRNVFQIFIVFFLWDSIFADPGRELFGYNRAQILTYVFGIIVVKAFVLSARAVDVAGEIADGRLTNYLLKPIGYFKYWLTRDLSSKALNFAFATVEVGILYFILRPPLFLQVSPIYVFAFLVAVALAILIFFHLLFITGLVPFWYPEAAWGAQFLFVWVFTEFLSGATFPLDILPIAIQKGLYLTPFPYLVFFPIQVYLGKLGAIEIVKGLGIMAAWIVFLRFTTNWLWHKGLRVYRAEGR